MKRRVRLSTAFVSFLLLLLTPAPARALDEPERLWLVGERAVADGLHLLARRALEQLVQRYPTDRHAGEALLLLGKTRLALGELEQALDAFRRAQTVTPPPGRSLEAKFWEGEALFRLKRYAEARAAYDTVVRTDAASPLAPDALYGFAWSELELGQPASAATAFSEMLKAWPEHPLAPSATFYLGRALVEDRRPAEALPHLEGFLQKHPGHKLAPDARYLLGWARVQTGDARAGLADLRAFADRNPSHPLAPAARRLILETMVRSGDRDDLQEAYRALMAQSPPTPEGLAEAAAVAGRLGRQKDQEAAWRRLRSHFPSHPLSRRAALELAGAAFKRKEWKEAVAYAQAAAESDEDAVRAEGWLLAGEAELKLKRWSAAEKAFESTLAVKDLDAGVRYRALAGLGLAHEEQREWRAALTAYEAVAGKSPDSELRAWARERAAAVRTRLGKPSPERKPAEKSSNGRKARSSS
jgi:TolA-binding protein